MNSPLCPKCFTPLGTSLTSCLRCGWGYRTMYPTYDSPMCLHDACPECHGTGRKQSGEMCVHMIACPCPKCTPRC